jgi:8-oxo-dGTP diphosphatase
MTAEGDHTTPVHKVRYVLGFAFDLQGRVALIRKNRPDWQKDKWNGIGGKIEVDELPRDAMAREFLEETGVATKPEQWDVVGHMHGPKFDLVVMTMRDDVVKTVLSMTDEKVDMFWSFNLPYNMIANVIALIELVKIKPSVRPTMFTLEYAEFTDEL